MTRTTQEVFDSHREAIETLNFEMLMADYDDEAILVTLNGSFLGKEAIQRGFFEYMFSQFKNPKITFENIAVEDDIVLIQWSAEAVEATIPYGVGVLIIQDGLIQRQGEWFHIVPKEG